MQHVYVAHCGVKNKIDPPKDSLLKGCTRYSAKLQKMQNTSLLIPGPGTGRAVALPAPWLKAGTVCIIRDGDDILGDVGLQLRFSKGCEIC